MGDFNFGDDDIDAEVGYLSRADLIDAWLECNPDQPGYTMDQVMIAVTR